jgi:hypothetical protein
MRWVVLIALSACGDDIHRFDSKLSLVHGCVDTGDPDFGPFVAVEYTLYNDTSVDLREPSLGCWATVETWDASGTTSSGPLGGCSDIADAPGNVTIKPGQLVQYTPLFVWNLHDPPPDGRYSMRVLAGDGGVSNTIAFTLPGCEP